MYHVIGIGNALVDTEFSISDDILAQTNLTRGNMTLANDDEQQALFDTLAQANLTPAKRSGGGSAANSMVTFASLGGRAFYNCRVGHDDWGQFYLNDLANSGVDTSDTHAKTDGITGSCTVLVTADGERTMQTHLGTSALINDSNVDFERLSKAEWLYLEGYLAMSPSITPAITKLRQQAGVHGVDVAISFADPAVVKFAKDGLLAMLGGGVSVIFCNLEEAQLFTDKKQHKACAKALLEHCKMAVVTNSGEPTIIAERTDGEPIITVVPTPAVAQVIDSNGAGDNYAGAFLYGLCQEYTPQECALLAGAIASQVVQQFGSRLSADSYQTIKQQVLK